MGGKVSSKMASAGRVVQAVRPHAPLIKFPNRQDIPRPNVQEALRTLAASLPQSSPTPPPVIVPPSLSRTPGPVTRISSTPDSLATARELPQRYRRRPLAAEEMDYIQRGGPE